MDLECIDKIPSNTKYTKAYVLLDRTNNKVFKCSREQTIKMLKSNPIAVRNLRLVGNKVTITYCVGGITNE